ncbi:MAG: HD-GYP domain-containing protein [Eggerthellaceae bacterium]|nr:HD-GYP domain-containing protein [Eggerthellaceae bacterium]
MAAGTQTDRRSTVFKVLFFCAFAFCVALCVYLTGLVNSATSDEAPNIDYIENWTIIDESGNSFEVGRTYEDPRAFEEDFTIVSKLPDEIALDSELCFMNRSDVSVYINGELRHEFERSRDTGIPGGSLKDFYVMVPLGPADASAELTIFRASTDWNPTIAPETLITSRDGLTDYLTGKYGLPFALSVVLFVGSLLVTIIGIAMRLWYKHEIPMLYAALGILVIACWLIAVSQITPFVVGVNYVDGIMGFMFCMLMPFGLMIYINSIQKGRYKTCFQILFVLSLASFVLWTILHFTGIQSLQTSLVYIDTILGIDVVCVLATLAIDLKRGYIKEYYFTALGFACFLALSIVEIVLLVFFGGIGGEAPLLIGLMLLLVFVALQQIDDVKRVRNQLEQEVNDRIRENDQMLIHIVQTLAGTIDAKDTYTNGHSSRVAEYTREIARRSGYDEDALSDIFMIGLLHDIGKIGIPDVVINKNGKLTAEEYETIKKHPSIGADILENIKEKPELAMGARSHHERYGGGGYPDGLVGEEIPEEARIIAVADAYDAMTSYRSYRDPMTQEQVREQIEQGSGTQFDPRFAAIMLEMIDEDTDYQMREKK